MSGPNIDRTGTETMADSFDIEGTFVMPDDKDRLHAAMEADASLPEVDTVWEHAKGGLYVVVSVGFDEDMGAIRIGYKSNRYHRKHCQYRTLENWLERFKPADR